IAANDPVSRRVRTDAVEVTDARAVVVRRTACVFEPAILDDATVDTDAGVDIGGVGFDELRTGIQEPDAINAWRVHATIENDFVVPGVADGEVSNRGVRAIGPDAKR